ncbi:MAG: hypothetical protein ACWGQW_23235, partial [bacterium]
SVWNKQMFEDFKPVVKSMVLEMTGESIDPESISVTTIPQRMQEAVKEIVAYERDREKPDMQHLGSNVEEAVLKVAESNDVIEGLWSFVERYLVGL